MPLSGQRQKGGVSALERPAHPLSNGAPGAAGRSALSLRPYTAREVASLPLTKKKQAGEPLPPSLGRSAGRQSAARAAPSLFGP